MIVAAQIALDDSIDAADASPIELARTLVREGARAIVLRDSEHLITRTPNIPSWFGPLIVELGIPVHYDGALTDAAAIERIARTTCASVVVGMAAAFEPLTLRWAQDILGPERMVVELACDGDYLYDPPANAFDMEVTEAAARLCALGARHLHIRDVTGVEVPVHRLQQVARTVDVGLRYSGVVRSLDDIAELMMVGASLEMVVLGSALHDGRIDIADANRMVGDR